MGTDGTVEEVDAARRVALATRAGTVARGFVAGALDLALPPQCLACDAPVAERGALSAEAIADPPPFDRCRAVATYDDIARTLVHGLKYRDRLDLAGWMARWMLRAGSDLIAEATVVVPIPLHRRRLWWRRFNQSGELARVIAGAAGKPFAPLALARVRPTAQQVGLSASERDRNVRGAFQVPVAAKMEVAGRRVLLVDDVLTTGATVRAATRALLRAGAVAVDVLVFARVVRGQS
jgi:ComF family protein